MSTQVKSYTIHDLREAFKVGFIACYREYNAPNLSKGILESKDVLVDKYYPIPKEPRILEDFNVNFRVMGGVLQGLIPSDGSWQPVLIGSTKNENFHISPARIKLWADLLENPFKEEE